MRSILATTTRWILAALVLVPAAATTRAHAAGPRDGGTISGQGHAVVKKFPTTVRATLGIPGKGKTVEEALADLKQRRQAAFEKLEKLGAETIKVPESVTVVGTIRADWPIASKDTESLFLELHKLGKTIEAAKLAGDQATAKLSPEEQEKAEEMGIAPEAIAEMAGASPGAPMLVCIARLAGKERQEAMAEAVNKARSDAAQKARSAGHDLGPLVHLAAHGAGARGVVPDIADPDMDDMMRLQYVQYARSMRYGMMPGLCGSDEGEEGETEAIAREPGPVRVTFTATATFLLAQPAPKAGQ